MSRRFLSARCACLINRDRFAARVVGVQVKELRFQQLDFFLPPGSMSRYSEKLRTVPDM